MIQTTLLQYSLNCFDMNERYVFDMDNTLIMTDKLNNISYNYALDQLGMHMIEGNTRITRSTIFANYPELTDLQKDKIIAIKQRYFAENINFTSPNVSLIKLLQSKEAAHCILWTRSDKERVLTLLKYYDLKKHFTNIVYSEKRLLGDDINKICDVFNCNSESLVFFEDDSKIIEELKLFRQKVFVASKCLYLL